jgi:hypothetical protein
VSSAAIGANTRSQIYVFGNSFASIVAVSELVKENKNFLWIQDGSSLDGIWRGFNHRNRILDLGMINFEIDVRHPDSSLDLETYTQYGINDCARFSDYVLDFIKQYSDIRKLPKVLIYENHVTYNDHLLSNDFSQLDRFKNLDISEMGNSIENHPSNKYTTDGKELLLDISYDKYVTKYFGKKIAHTLFLTWASKLVGENVTKANTFRHRAAWLPLPYPETILEALSGDLKQDYSYSFHYPTDETFSEFVNRIFVALSNDQSIKIIQANELSDLQLKEILDSDAKIFWGSKIEAFLRLNDQYTKHDLKEFRNQINVDLYEVKAEPDFANYVFLNNDPNDTTWYRLTVQPNVLFEDGSKIAVIESRGSRRELHDSQYFSSLGLELRTHIKSILGVPVFLTLNGEQYREYESWHRNFVNFFPKISFGGGASFAYSATFSDQVIQGIHFVRKECKDVSR